MGHVDTPPGIREANAARVRLLAEAAAHDDVKLRRAVNIVRAAIRLEVITIDDVTNDTEAAA